MVDRELLAACIKESGLSPTRYADLVLLRQPRTVHRWLSGESPIPGAVMAFLLKSAARNPKLSRKTSGGPTPEPEETEP